MDGQAPRRSRRPMKMVARIANRALPTRRAVRYLVKFQDRCTQVDQATKEISADVSRLDAGTSAAFLGPGPQAAAADGPALPVLAGTRRPFRQACCKVIALRHRFLECGDGGRDTAHLSSRPRGAGRPPQRHRHSSGRQNWRELPDFPSHLGSRDRSGVSEIAGHVDTGAKSRGQSRSARIGAGAATGFPGGIHHAERWWSRSVCVRDS